MANDVITNGEKFITAIERIFAFKRFCNWHNKRTCEGCPLALTPEMRSNACHFAWLDLKYKEEEKQLPCPFCGGNCKVVTKRLTHFVECRDCHYRSKGSFSERKTIAAHNRLYRAAKAHKESEVK